MGHLIVVFTPELKRVQSGIVHCQTLRLGEHIDNVRSQPIVVEVVNGLDLVLRAVIANQIFLSVIKFEFA
jgi:hypothetical protein